MRILYVVPYAPSLIRVRPYQLIRALASRNHEVTVATLWSSAEDLESLEHLERENVVVCSRRLPKWRPVWNCLRTVPTRMPLQAAFCWEPGLLDEVKSVCSEKSFDVAHVEHLRGSLYGLSLRRSLCRNGGSGHSPGPQVPIVWDSVDCISHLFQQAKGQSKSLKGRFMASLEFSRTRRFEGWLVGQFDHVVATSSTDCDALAELRKLASERGQRPGSSDLSTLRDRISVLPNGVDLEYFRPPTESRDKATLVFTGKMSYHANIAAARYLVKEIMPRIWRKRPEVKLVLAGKNPPRSLLALAFSSADPGSPSVEITGMVPDLRPYLHRATISVAPLLYGAGIQNKVLEAMACANPVVTSSRAVSSLSAKTGEDLLVADSAEDFARSVLGLLEDGDRRDTLGLAGRAYVESQHDWNVIAGRLEGIYQDVLESSKQVEK